jgi:mRNA interferase MazF
MTRGEIWTVAGGSDYAGKPRPVIVVQADRLDDLLSVTICPFTTSGIEAPIFRVPIVPSEQNGLRQSSRLMVDKITTVSRSKLGERIGRLSSKDVIRLDRAILVFLGLAD